MDDGLGKRIAELRKKRSLTQQELAEIVQMSTSTIAKWELGERDPDSKMILVIAKTFGVTADYLLGLSDDQNDATQLNTTKKYHGGFSIVMQTSEVIRLLETHRTAHIFEYQRQLEGWNPAFKIYLAKLDEWVTSGAGPNDPPEQPPEPRAYTEQYDNLLAMVTEHIHDEIELGKSDFATIVKDKFDWKVDFELMSTFYNVK